MIRQRLRGRAVPARWSGWPTAGSAAILPTSPTYAAGSTFLRPYADRLARPAERDRPGAVPRPVAEPTATQAERDPRARTPGPLWLGCGRLVYYKGFLNAIRALTRVRGHACSWSATGPTARRSEAEAARLGVADRVRLPGRAAALPRPRAVLPGGRRLLVPLERAERGVRAGAGRGDGQRLPGDQHARSRTAACPGSAGTRRRA